MKDHKPAFFVEVKDHIAIRRNILQSLRDILDSLQKFHDFHKKKEQKLKKEAELKSLLSKTNRLLLSVKGSLPEFKVEKQKEVKIAKQKDAAQKTLDAKPEPKVQKPKSELDMLEDELAQIERKLSKLA